MHLLEQALIIDLKWVIRLSKLMSSLGNKEIKYYNGFIINFISILTEYV